MNIAASHNKFWSGNQKGDRTYTFKDLVYSWMWRVKLRNLRLSRRWRFNWKFSGLWRYVACLHLQGEVKMEAAGPQKRWLPNTTLHFVTTQKTSTWCQCIINTLRTRWPGFNSWQRQWCDLFSSPPALGRTQHPLQWVPGTYSPGSKPTRAWSWSLTSI
jgi:hypothetical protein